MVEILLSLVLLVVALILALLGPMTIPSPSLSDSGRIYADFDSSVQFHLGVAPSRRKGANNDSACGAETGACLQPSVLERRR